MIGAEIARHKYLKYLQKLEHTEGMTNSEILLIIFLNKFVHIW